MYKSSVSSDLAQQYWGKKAKAINKECSLSNSDSDLLDSIEVAVGTRHKRMHASKS